jgi:hypothetical protein
MPVVGTFTVIRDLATRACRGQVCDPTGAYWPSGCKTWQVSFNAGPINARHSTQSRPSSSSCFQSLFPYDKYLLTYGAEPFLRSCQLCSHSENSQEILRNSKVHHRVHKSPPLVPILSQFNSVPTIPTYLSKIHFNIVHPPTSWSSQWSLSPMTSLNVIVSSPRHSKRELF